MLELVCFQSTGIEGRSRARAGLGARKQAVLAVPSVLPTEKERVFLCFRKMFPSPQLLRLQARQPHSTFFAATLHVCCNKCCFCGISLWLSGPRALSLLPPSHARALSFVHVCICACACVHAYVCAYMTSFSEGVGVTHLVRRERERERQRERDY